MKKFVSLATATAMVLGYGNTVFAADMITSDQSCSCVTNAPASGAAGRIVNASGDVAISGGTSYKAAKAGTPISAGSEVVVNSGSATVQVGQCTESLSSNSSLRVTSTGDGQLCVVNAGYGGAAAGSAGLSPAAWTVIGVAAAVGVGVAIYNNNNDDDDDNHRRRRPATSD